MLPFAGTLYWRATRVGLRDSRRAWFGLSGAPPETRVQREGFISIESCLTPLC